MTSDYEFIGYFSFLHYFDTYNILELGEVDIVGIFVFIVVTIVCLVASMIYFERRDIAIS
jgi:ABC-type transport system involved in multi-copper enzyme maturation permease subunit